DRLRIYLNFTLCVPVDIRHTLGHTVFVDKYAAYECVGEERQILCSLRIRNREPGRREKGSDITAPAAVTAVVTRRVTVMGHIKLRKGVGQVGYTDFFGTLLNDVINAPPGDWRQIHTVGITRPILDRTRHSHVTLSLGKPG